MYKTNNNIIAIRATIAVNSPVVAIFAIAVVKDTLSVKFIAVSIEFPNEVAT